MNKRFNQERQCSLKFSNLCVACSPFDEFHILLSVRLISFRLLNLFLDSPKVLMCSLFSCQSRSTPQTCPRCFKIVPSRKSRNAVCNSFRNEDNLLRAYIGSVLYFFDSEFAVPISCCNSFRNGQALHYVAVHGRTSHNFFLRLASTSSPSSYA